MGELNKAFRDRIDRVTDAEMLETEMHSLERLLFAVRRADHFREASAKAAYIRDRLRALAEEEMAEEMDR